MDSHNFDSTTYLCHETFQGIQASRFSEIVILSTDTKWNADNRLLNRLKYNTPGAHIHMFRNYIMNISNL